MLYVLTPETLAQVHEGNQWVNLVRAGDLEAAHRRVRAFGGATLHGPDYNVESAAREITAGIQASPERRAWRQRVGAKAQVGTDVATVWAISPEQLHHFLTDGAYAKLSWREWVDNLQGLEEDIRKHGGAVFHTGGDGAFEVVVEDAVRGQGYMAPYGTPSYRQASTQRVLLAHASNRIARLAWLRRVAGWWGIDEGGRGGPGKKDTGLHLGDGPLDMRLDFIDKIDLVYRQAWDRPVTHAELKAVFDVSHLAEGGSRFWPLNGWVDEAVEATGYPHSVIVALDKDALETGRRLWRDYRNSGFARSSGLPDPTPDQDLYQGFLDHMRAAVELGREDAQKLLGVR